MSEQELSRQVNPETIDSSNASDSLRQDTPFGGSDKLHLAQNRDQLDEQIPPAFKEFLELLMKEAGKEATTEEPDTPKERQSEGMKLFDETVSSIDQAAIEAFKERRPTFREAIQKTDEHLLSTANDFVLEQYESGRLDKLSDGKERISDGVRSVDEQLKKIPLHKDKVEAIELINFYLDPSTDQGAKSILLQQLSESNGKDLASSVENLGNAYQELRPHVATEIEKRTKVHQAYNESQEARGIYGQMLSQTIQSPLVDMEEAKEMASEMRELQTDSQTTHQKYFMFSVPPGTIDNFKIQFPIPEAPRTLQA